MASQSLQYFNKGQREIPCSPGDPLQCRPGKGNSPVYPPPDGQCQEMRQSSPDGIKNHFLRRLRGGNRASPEAINAAS